MNPKKAMRNFLRHVATAPIGTRFETGLTYDDRRGWRVYQRVGQAIMAMSPDSARSLYATYQSIASRPEWRGLPPTELNAAFEELPALAADAERKNAAAERPASMPMVSPFGGRA